MFFLTKLLDTQNVLIVCIIVLFIATYLVTVRDMKNTEHFMSKQIPEFQFDTVKQTADACDAIMKNCKGKMPFCLDLNGNGPTVDCYKKYMNFFTEKNGMIPVYSDGDWGEFEL